MGHQQGLNHDSEGGAGQVEEKICLQASEEKLEKGGKVYQHRAAEEEQIIVEEAQIQLKQQQFSTKGEALGFFNCLENGAFGMIEQHLKSEPIAVDGNKTGNDKKHGPQSG